MTLIELLIALVISTLLGGVIVTAFVVSLQSDAAVKGRVEESHDAQLLVAYLTGDMQSVTPGGIDTSAPGSCSTSDGLDVVHLSWLDASNATVGYDYYVRQAGTEWQLVRDACDGNTSHITVVGHNLRDPHSLFAPAVIDAARLPQATTSNRLLTLKVVDNTGYTYTENGIGRTAPSTSPSPPPSSAPLAPTLIGVTTTDTDTDGRLDALTLSFSGSVPGCGSGYTLTGLPAGYTQGATTMPSSSTVNLAIIPGPALTPTTSVGSLSVSFSPGAGCSAAAFSALSPDDGIAPQLTAIGFVTGTTPGLIQTNDKLLLTYSEPIQLGTPSANSVVETSKAGSGSNDGVRVPDLTSGSYISLPASNYVSNNKTATFSATFNVNPGQSNQVVMTVGSCQASPCQVTAGSAGAIAWRNTVALVQDTSGNDERFVTVSSSTQAF